MRMSSFLHAPLIPDLAPATQLVIPGRSPPWSHVNDELRNNSSVIQRRIGTIYAHKDSSIPPGFPRRAKGYVSGRRCSSGTSSKLLEGILDPICAGRERQLRNAAAPAGPDPMPLDACGVSRAARLGQFRIGMALSVRNCRVLCQAVLCLTKLDLLEGTIIINHYLVKLVSWYGAVNLHEYFGLRPGC